MHSRLLRIAFAISFAGFIELHSAANAQEKMTLAQAYEELQSETLSEVQRKQLLQFFGTQFKSQDLSSPKHQHIMQVDGFKGGYVGWAIRAPNRNQVLVVSDREDAWQLTRLDSDLWVGVERFRNFDTIKYYYRIDSQNLPAEEGHSFQFEAYPWMPESMPQDNVPHGELISMPAIESQKYFVGTTRDWWVYVPANYTNERAESTKLMVFNDGEGFVKGEGNAVNVLDNLIAAKRIPSMIAVFVNPGKFIETKGDSTKNPKANSNRGNEYDSCTPRYANFLDEEILAIVREKYPYSEDPWDHAILGSSSGGSCAFTASWYRNDLFRRVVTFVGSFCDFRPLKSYPLAGTDTMLSGDQFGQWKTAHDYPALIRKTQPPKPMKVLLQDGTNDLDNQLGNWFLNNQRMAAALKYSNYDYRFVAGQGMHSKKHGMSILPEIMIWLWTDASPKQSLEASR